MHLRTLFLVLSLFAGFRAEAAASAFEDAAARLEGEWRGGDFVLKVDAERAQASVDSARPFAWEHFLVKEVTPGGVVFTIGAELYRAQISDDVLTLSGTSFRGTRVLLRAEGDLRGTTTK